MNILKQIESVTTILQIFTNWRKKIKGDGGCVIEELKENSRLCWLIMNEDVNLKQIIAMYSTLEYDRLIKEGFDFNSLKRKKIRTVPPLENIDLASWEGKTTEELVGNIYDKIKDLKTKYQFAATSHNILWKRRIANIQKRILLLLRHSST